MKKQIMQADQIKVNETKNKDGSVTYEMLMSNKQYKVMSKVLAKSGYTIASYFKAFMENLVKEDADGPVHQWLDQLIVESGDELGVKKEAIKKAKARIAKRSKNNGELVNNE